MNIPSEFITLIGFSILTTILRLLTGSLRSKHITKMLQLKVIATEVEVITKIKKYYTPSLE